MLDSWILLWKGRVKLPRFHSASYLYPTVFLFHFSHPLPVQHPDSPILPQGVRQRQCCMEWGSRARQLLCQPGSQTELPIFTPLNTWAQQLIPSLNPSAPLCPAPRACGDKEETGTGCACWEKRGWDWGTGLCRGSGPLRTAAAAWGSLSCEDQSPSGGKDSSGWQCPACPMLCHSSTHGLQQLQAPHTHGQSNTAQGDRLNATTKTKLMQPGDDKYTSEVPCILNHFKIFLSLVCNVNVR